MALKASVNALFCRLCLEELDMVYMFSSDAVTRMVIFDNFPEMNLGATNSIRLCKDCYTNLDFVMTVKSGVPLERIDFLQQQFTRATGIKFCAFCLVLESRESKFPDYRCGPTQVQQIVQYVIPGFKYIKRPANICNFCWSWIWKMYSFKQQCNQIDHFLLQTCRDNHLDVLTDTDIYTLLMVNVHVRTMRQQIRKEAQQTIDLGQIQFQSYISRAKENYSKLVLALQSNIQMNLDIIRHMESSFGTGGVYPNITGNSLSYPGTDVPPVNQHNSVRTFDNRGWNAYNNNTQEFILTIDLNDSDEETVVNPHNEDVTFVDDATQSSDEVKSVDLDIDETDVKLQLYEAENSTAFGNTEVEASASAPLAKEELSRDIEEEISTFHINADLLTEFIDSNASTPTYDNCCTFVETPRQADVPFANNPTDATEEAVADSCGVEADLNQPIDLTLRSWQKSRTTELEPMNSSNFLRECWGCYVCAAKFQSKKAIIKHTFMHERPWNKFGKFSCPFCPYRVNWKGCVTRHQRVHAFENLHAYSRSAIKYLCIFCNLICSVKEDIQAHMIRHIITWNHFQCLHCMFVGNSSESLRTHYKHFHIIRAKPYSQTSTTG